MTSQPSSLAWLQRLRWLAICGQAATLAVAGGFLKLPIPWIPFALIFGTTVFTNIVLRSLPPETQQSERTAASVLFLDVILLTMLLRWSGGPENPFSILYLLHVVLAAFDPVANLKVGVQVLKECIQRAGSVEAGLRYYVGAGNQASDNGYASKVLAEQDYLKKVAGGKSVPATIRTTTVVATPVVAPAEPPAEAIKPGEPAPVQLGAAAQPQIVALAH